MTDPVESVAKALCAVDEKYGAASWKHWEQRQGGEKVMAVYREKARAAIQAFGQAVLGRGE